MKFGCRLTLGEFKFQDIVTFARRSEELGYDSIWVNDHLVGGPPAQHAGNAHP